MHPTPEDDPSPRQHAVVDGHRIAWDHLGDPAGEPLVLLHGTPSHSYIWRNVSPHLADVGYHVHLFDLLGYGASERPLAADTSVTGQELVLAAMLDRWGLTSAHIVGHDIGGGVALRTVVHAPARVRTITVIDSVSYDSWPSSTWAAIRDRGLDAFAAMSATDFEQLMTRQLHTAVHDPGVMNGAVLDAYLAPLAGDLGRVSYFRHQMEHYDSRHTEEISHALPTVERPVHLIWGEEDRWQPIRWAHRLAEDLPTATLTSIPGAGHFAMEDDPQAIAEAILDGLDGSSRQVAGG